MDDDDSSVLMHKDQQDQLAKEIINQILTH